MRLNFFRFSESIALALNTLRTNKFRSFLTVFGVVVQGPQTATATGAVVLTN